MLEWLNDDEEEAELELDYPDGRAKKNRRREVTQCVA